MAKFRELASQCEFPWLQANVLDPALGDSTPLGNTAKTVLLEANGLKVGVIGLVEREWLDTINSLPPNLVYKSASETALELAPQLRAQGADMVVALTHQREPNDKKLAEKTKGALDAIFGGHDHFYAHSIVNGTHILRSGTDFKQLSYIEAWKATTDGQDHPRWDFRITRHDVVGSVPEDPEAAGLVTKLQGNLKSRLEKPIGYTAIALDARFTTVRLRESNYGNLVCDIMRLYYGADCALMASGTIRGDQIYPPGILRVKDIMDCFPFEDPVVVLRVSGEALRHALENSVSTYPAQEGRFPQVSNIRMEFDPKLAPMKRVTNIKVGRTELDPTKSYVLSTRDYMARGKDGFTSLLYRELGGSTETVVSEESGMLISTLLRQYFLSIRVIDAISTSDHIGKHWRGMHDSLHSSHPVKQPKHPSSTRHDHIVAEQSDDDEIHHETNIDREERRTWLARRALKRWRRMAGIRRHPECVHENQHDVDLSWTRGITPRVDGRIVMASE